IAPTVILAMAIGRIGCLMSGCCWGQVCATPQGDKSWPWAVHFPYGSPAYLVQWKRQQLTVPDELLMTSPIHGRLEPIPAILLKDPELERSDALKQYAEHSIALAGLSDSQRNTPAANDLRSKMKSLRPRIPGADKRQRSDFVAAAVHLRKVADATGQDTDTALASLRHRAADQKSLWVHPTQAYDAISLLLMFFMLSAIFFRTQRHGMVSAWAMVLYPISRYCLELLRADNPRDVAGLTISQAMSIGVLIAGLLLMVILVKLSPGRPAEVAATGG
ncbi:MAG: prolipoprotein diacylglyceryl transferase family protein, partial [Phycisphaerae bacterium]